MIAFKASYVRILIRTGLLVAVTCFSCPVGYPQQATRPLTVDDCIRLAEGVPSQITLARQDREIAARDATMARAGFLPRTLVQNTFTYNSPLKGTPGAMSYVALNGIREYSSLVTAIQEIDTSGRLRAEWVRAKAMNDAASASEGIARRELRRAVSLAYYRLLLSRRLVEVIRASLNESESFAERTRLLFEHGEASRADLVKAGAQASLHRQALDLAEMDATIANQSLASFWTIDVNQPVALHDVLSEPPPAPETPPPDTTVYLRRLEFNLLDAQRRINEADARRARAALLPQTNLIFQYGLDANAISIRERGYAAFLNLNIPLFDWFRARSETQQFRLRARQVQASQEITQRNFSAEYQSALTRTQQLYHQITLASEAVKLAEEDLSLSRIRYEGGEGAALDVVTAQSQLTQARSNYYATVANYFIARLDLEVASGR